MKARLILEMELVDGAERPLSRAALLDALDDTESAIRNRLFGMGFLPDDVLVERYAIETEIVED